MAALYRLVSQRCGRRGELARFGRWVEVLSPVEVQIELARVGRELVAAYGEVASPA